MKTLTFQVQFSETNNSIVDDIKQQINYHLEQKEIARQMNNMFVDLRLSMLTTIQTELNNYLGEQNAWYIEKNYQNALHFKDGVYRNTCYPLVSIEINVKRETVKFGNIEYTKTLLDKGVEVVLKKLYYADNGKIKNVDKPMETITITDITKVHEICKDVYISYFTNKVVK